jgi:hypothetical protein
VDPVLDSNYLDRPRLIPGQYAPPEWDDIGTLSHLGNLFGDSQIVFLTEKKIHFH